MVVQKISVNNATAQSYGAVLPQQNPQTAVAPQEPKRDKSKIIAWSLAGLATAGLAGVLIYNLRKGRSDGTTDAFAGLGTYLRKFLDESVFNKSIDAVKNGATDVVVKLSEDGNDIQLCNEAKQFGCHLVKKIPEGRTDVPNFEYSSRTFGLKIFNKDRDTAQFKFGFGQMDEFKLSIEVDSWRGNIKGCTATHADESYNFTNEQCKSILDNLDLKRLINDDEYRSNYGLGLLRQVHDVVRKTKFQKIADKTGKSLEEVATTYDSKEFNNIFIVQEGLLRVNSEYNLLGSKFESGVLKSMEGKDGFALLEEYITNESKRLNIVDDLKINERYFADGKEKTCFDLEIPTEDGTGISEHIRFSNDGEYILYERTNPEDSTKKLLVERYFPPLSETSSCRDRIEVDGVSFFTDSPANGHDRVEVSLPDSDETIKFSYNAAKGCKWNEGIDYPDELQPHMGYIEKLVKVLSDENSYAQFINDLITRGRETLAELAKVEPAAV